MIAVNSSSQRKSAFIKLQKKTEIPLKRLIQDIRIR